jgi:hypothetical protein
MALHGYARDHSGISIVLTLAGARDAFARETKVLRKAVGEVMGREVSAKEALRIGERALEDSRSVMPFPGMTPPQVQTALHAIKEKAFYLRQSEDGSKYYASLEPSVNIALAQIRRSLGAEGVKQLLAATARKVVKQDVPEFLVTHDVSAPEHVPDKKDRPVLALVALAAGVIDVEAMVTTKGPNQPRTQQNTVLLLVPDTVTVKQSGGGGLFDTAESKAQKAYQDLEELGRWVLAMGRLREKPRSTAKR